MIEKRFQGRFLGVLGGMGPLAGAFFMTRLVALTEAERDQQHMPAVLWNDPRIPDRLAACFGNGEDPLPWMQNGIDRLVGMGAGAIAIPCNTAHIWYERLAAATPVPVLHIVQSVLNALRRRGVDRGRIGLMGTSATLRLGLYQQALQAQGYECVVPSAEEIERYCTPCIALVKTNRIEQSLAPALECIRLLRDRGIDALVLGCTELPLALPEPQRLALGLPVVDSVDALAIDALSWYRSESA